MHPQVLQVWLRRRWLAGLSDQMRAHVTEYRSEGPGSLLATVPVLWPEVPRTRRLADLLAAASAALAELEVRWCLCGALAAMVHGSYRPSAGVDVLVDGGASAGAPHELWRRHRFRPRLVEAARLAEIGRAALLFEHEPTRGPLDVIVASSLEEAIVAGAEMREVDGVAIPVAAAEHVVAVKLARGHAKDIDDAAAILVAQGERLAIAPVEEAVARCERALGRSDLLPLLRQVLPLRQHRAW